MHGILVTEESIRDCDTTRKGKNIWMRLLYRTTSTVIILWKLIYRYQVLECCRVTIYDTGTNEWHFTKNSKAAVL